MMIEFLLFLVAVFTNEVASSNFTQELLLTGLIDGSLATGRKEGSSQGAMMGRGMVMNVRLRTSGQFAYESGELGLGIFYRQYTDGNPGGWQETAHLRPDDLPAQSGALESEGSESFFAGITQSKTATGEYSTIINGRSGIRMDSDKFSLGGTPETKPIILASAFGHTYTGGAANGFKETGHAYIFTGEYYHWTQTTTLRYPSVVLDDEYHFGRTVSLDQQTQDTAAISCPGCDPGSYKTTKITSGLTGSQGRGAVYIYKGSVTTGLRHWTATQLLWPRHNKWYYFGGGFTSVDGSTLVTDACKGAICTYNTFALREYDVPSTDLFVYVKQDVTGLWSEQQVLTDDVMTVEIYSRYFEDVELHDDTIAMGITLQVRGNKATQNTFIQRGQVLVWYPNKPSYDVKETFRYKADVRARGRSDDDSNSARFNQHQWSLQQFLRLEVASTSYKNYFGQYVSISGDRMVVGARGYTGTHPSAVLYTRPRQGGFWSQQQILIHPDEARIGITAAVLYNNLFTTHGLGDATFGSSFVQYQSEMAHGKWTCLLVSLFDEFGDGWDTAKLRVSYSDGTYDYYYPVCNSPNPLEFEYCPSMAQQGGTYTFEIVHHEEARFNWEIEWKVQMNLAPHKSLWGNSSDVFLATRHSRMSFYWNPVTLSFEKLDTAHLIKSTITCEDCPDKSHSHRSLYGLSSSIDADDEKFSVDEDGSRRALHHAARTASPTVSPAPTLVQGNEYLDDWEKLTMTTYNPLQPWFKSDRSGTYFMVSDLEGKKLFRRDTQCGGGLTPLTHSCWLNYPNAIPDGEYIARIGGARAGIATGLHTWAFCGMTGGQLEHLQFRVHNGQCYPVQRFTKSRFCSFKQGSGVLLEVMIDLGLFDGLELSSTQREHVFKAYAGLLPLTKSEDFTIVGQRRDDDGHLHVTVGLELKLMDHGFDPSDFSAVSELESKYQSLMHEVTSSGALASALASSFEGTGAFLEVNNVRVEMTKFDTASIPRGPIDVDDDSPRDVTAEDVVDRDWLKGYHPASAREVEMYSLLSYLSDAVALSGYIGLLVCAVYGAKAVYQKYRQHAPQLERDLEAASSVVKKATKKASRRSQSRLSVIQNKVLNFLDDFSDYVVDGEVTHDASTGEALIGEVVIPSVDGLFLPTAKDDEKKKHRNKKSKKDSATKSSFRNSESASHVFNYGYSPDEARKNDCDGSSSSEEQKQEQEHGDEASVSVFSYDSYNNSESGSGSSGSSGSEGNSESSCDSESLSVSDSSSYSMSSSDSSSDDNCYVMQSFRQ